MISFDFDELLTHCDRIVVLNGGHLGTPAIEESKSRDDRASHGRRRVKWRLAALVLGAALLLLGAFLSAHVSPVEALATLLRGSLGTPAAIGGTLRETTPLLIRRTRRLSSPASRPL